MPHFSDISNVVPDPDALDLIPEVIVHESTVLPISTTDGAIHVIVPRDEVGSTIEKLQFILERSVTYDTANRRHIAEIINQYYPRPGAVTNLTDIELPDSIPQYGRDSEFPFLNLTGRIRRQTPGSVSFDLGRWTHSRFVFSVVGWLDAHFPCSGSHKLFVRCSLPEEYINFESMRDLIPDITSALKLPGSVSYKIHLESHVSATSMEHPQEGLCGS